MSRTARLGVLIAALMSLFAVTATTASAVTWHNSGNTAYTATGGATSISATGVTLGCTSSWFMGTMNATPFTGFVWTASSGTGGFTGCRMSGQDADVTCGWTVTATGMAGSVMSGTVHVQCTSRLSGNLTCVTGGSTHGTYTNPTVPTPGTGVAPTSLSLNIHNGTIACLLGNGDNVHITTTSLRITNGTGGAGTFGPIITRTA